MARGARMLRTALGPAIAGFLEDGKRRFIPIVAADLAQSFAV